MEFPKQPRIQDRPMIVPIDGSTPDLLEELRLIRKAGNVPLVGDPRWQQDYWDTLCEKLRHTEVPPATAWATLTSGSSGSPRIVLRSAASWSDSFAAVERCLGARDGDVIALPAPPASSLTLFSLAHALSGGPRPALGNFADAELFHGTPQGLRTVLEAGSMPRLRSALVGGSFLDPALRAEAESRGIRVSAYYGAAELSFVAYDQGDGLQAFPGVELRIRDGELWVDSPYAALGYDGTNGPLRREGNWASVGDRAELVDSRLRLLGRADDAILSASATIVPEEVEAVLRAIPGVRDALVFGMPREPIGSLVCAMLEMRSDGPAEIKELVSAGLAPVHRPRRWFSGRIPRTASGKPARAEAVRMALCGEVAPLAIQ